MKQRLSFVAALVAFFVGTAVAFPTFAQQSGGAFVPGSDYTVSGAWTFSGTVPSISSLGGSIVGTTATQTLTNKTLTSAALTTPVISGGTSSARNLVAAYTSAGAIALAGGTVTIGGGSASAMTLAACTAGDAGMALDITAITAQAHTVTVTAGFNNAGAGGDVATFGGAIGDSMRIVCANAIWNVIVLRNVTLG
jgi:hypothetical protein